MSLGVIFSIIFIHWFADFVMQREWEATNKSKNNLALTSHVLTYAAIWMYASLAYSLYTGNFLFLALFAQITFVCHWVTDYFTSRLNTKLLAKGDTHNFFVSIGFDQVLHYVQLFLTFYLLTGK